MKKLRLFILIVLASLSIHANAIAILSGSCGTNVTFVLDDDGTLLISGNGAMTNYNSYSSYPWYNKKSYVTKVEIEYGVTSIGNNAFYTYSGLTSVTIPNSVTSIGRYAFYKCSGLTSIIIPNSVTNIGDYAFSDCSGLTSIIIPNSVTNIGNSFSGCSGLTSINVETGNKKYDSRGNCNAIIETSTNTLIRGCMNTIIPNSVTSIGYGAFSGCSDLTVDIPNSVTSIESHAFNACSNLSVTIPSSVTSIGGYAFNACSNLSVTIPSSVTNIGDNLFVNCTGLSLTLGCSLEVIPTTITLSKLTFLDGIESIKSDNYKQIKAYSVTIPNSVTSISMLGFAYVNSFNITCKDEKDFSNYIQREDKIALFSHGFEDCGHSIYIGGEKITDITIPNSVTRIGDHTFLHCSGLASVTIPSSVKSIGERAFSRLTSLTVDETNPNFSSENNVLFNKDKTELIFAGGKKEGSYIIPNSVTSIGDYAFLGCPGLNYVTIPNSVTSIGNYAFEGCELKSLTIPNSVTSIGKHAFSKGKFSSITIPNSVTNIGEYAFYNCAFVTKITLPNSLTSIGSYAFYYTRPRTVYNYAETPHGDNTILQYDYTNTATLYVPAGSLDTYKSTTPWSRFANILPIPAPITSITINASSNELTVGENLTLTATILPGNASEKTVTWSSSDTKVATVDAITGEVTAVGEGSATITATAADGSGVTGTCEITVKAAQGGNDDPSTGGTVDVTPRPTSGNYMFVDYVKAKAKQTVQIPVEVVTEEENIVGFQCNIKLPEGMEFVKNAKGNVVFTWNNDRIDGHTITSKIAADGSVKLVAASMEGATFMETEGVMFYFSATVPEGMEGEQALQLYNVRVSDIDDNEIRCPDMTSVIDVKTYTLGDLNDDGEWSVVDVTMAIKAILDETYIEAGDMNEDGEMSVVDATTIIKYVLNEGPIEKASAPAAKRLKANAIADKPKFVVSPIYVEPGTNNMYLTVDMLNKQEYIGFQTEICLPEGFKFYTNSKGKPTVTLNTDRLETHTATSKLKDERTLRILVASMESDPILDNEGELLRVRVVADANVEAGNHTATLIDSRVSDDNDIEAKLDVTNGYLRVFGEEAISLVVPDGGYATLCLPYNATVPTGLKAYKATGMKNGMVVIEEQTSIAACTPMIIEGAAGTYNFSGDNSDADEFEYSVGSLKSSLVPVENNSGYVLQNLSEGLGFYKIADALTVPSFRCVLDGASVSAAPAFVPVGFDEDANAIEAIGNNPQTTGSVYTLDGKRVKTMEKGKIYIVGGVKMIVK